MEMKQNIQPLPQIHLIMIPRWIMSLVNSRNHARSLITGLTCLVPTRMRLTLLTLLPELQLEIFDHLSPISSTCLGLTCKYLYAIHRKFHGSVDLKVKDMYQDHWDFSMEVEADLSIFLNSWMLYSGNIGLVWGGRYGHKFVTEETLLRLEQEDEVEELQDNLDHRCLEGCLPGDVECMFARLSKLEKRRQRAIAELDKVKRKQALNSLQYESNALQ